MKDAKGRRAFAVPTSHGSDDADLTALDKTSIAEWLAREKLTSERLTVARRLRVPRRLRRARGAHERVGGHPLLRVAPASVRDASLRPCSRGPQGTAGSSRSCRRSSATKLRLGLAVADVAPAFVASAGESGKTGVDVMAIGAAPRAVGIHAERVIFAAPQFVARAVVRPVSRGAASASLGVPVRRVDGREPHAVGAPEGRESAATGT